MKKNNITYKYMIIKDRVELYKDFTYNLLSYIFEYYLDKETLSLDEDIKNHFMFCYNKVCDEFLKEEISFSGNKELIEYYYTYYYHHFYKTEEEIKKDYFIRFWNSIFEIDRPQNKNMIKVLVELYSIFDKSIKTSQNILELV